MSRLAQDVQIVQSHTLGWENARRPVEGLGVRVNKRTGLIQYRYNDIWINSSLRKDEWEVLDDAIVEAAGPRTDIFERIPKVEHASIGVLTHQYSTVSEMTEAQVTMTGQEPGETDLSQFNLNGVPMPVIFKQVNYGERLLQAGRLEGGSPIDRTQISQATRVVSEQLANMLTNGRSAINFNGATIYGLTTQPNRNTGSATGDWGTISNIYPTVLAMISSLDADNYHGPWELDVASTQYIEALEVYTATGETAITRILAIPDMQSVNSNDQLAAGSLVLRQIGPDIVEWAQITLGGQTVNGMEIALVEWISGDGMTHHFKVMAIGAPVVKSDYETQSGVAHYTGA